ncbi:MAG: hypothetical protein P8Q36_15495 [Alphaproteobacteria bacterium]|jgi:hypothetical protein|nr:hypothetical protein [Rhodospirillaceae bacterium]MBT6203231.1 hypothetical protein [Rhodospirillaceae bacterium]MBT7615101.1 hypothetical protein [Rhodospirillaceae bacterium]MBT7648499.1 hypothetical protein [Rhodospirillaceae bacterium]MDG2482250.1 hypothetical protein [Alphaproteobacteria bacterium]
MTDMVAIVEHYASLGVHRTGSAIDRATTDWLQGFLDGMGARTRRHHYDFEMVQGSVGAQPPFDQLPMMPLYYAASGGFETKSVLVRPIELDAAHTPEDVNAQLEAGVMQARDAGADLLLLSTQCPKDSLCAINRDIDDRIEFPIALAPGSALSALQAGSPHIHYDVAVETAGSDNLIADLGDRDDTRAPLIVTTPISGWFSCAGERGSGLAVALQVSETIAKRHPVKLVLASGHELGYLGARRFVEGFEEAACGILHIGSCVADLAAFVPSDGQFLPGKVGAVANLGADGQETVSRSLAPLGIVTRRPARPLDPTCWVGESETWAPKGLPMLSIAGVSNTFHTPEDTFASAGSAELLETVATSVSACGNVLATHG